MDFKEGTFSAALPLQESPQLRFISDRLVATASIPFGRIACLIHWFHIVSLPLKCCVAQKWFNVGETFDAALSLLFLLFSWTDRSLSGFFPCWESAILMLHRCRLHLLSLSAALSLAQMYREAESWPIRHYQALPKATCCDLCGSACCNQLWTTSLPLDTRYKQQLCERKLCFA